MVTLFHPRTSSHHAHSNNLWLHMSNATYYNIPEETAAEKAAQDALYQQR